LEVTAGSFTTPARTSFAHVALQKYISIAHKPLTEIVKAMSHVVSVDQLWLMSVGSREAGQEISVPHVSFPGHCEYLHFPLRHNVTGEKQFEHSMVVALEKGSCWYMEQLQCTFPTLQPQPYPRKLQKKSSQDYCLPDSQRILEFLRG
jgi:hypothetical protein